MAKKAKVKRKPSGDMVTATRGPIGGMVSATRSEAQPVLSTVVSDSTGLPTLSESIQMREMQKAKGLGPQEVASAKGLGIPPQAASSAKGLGIPPQAANSSSRKAKVKRNNAKKGDDVYDPEIGFGASKGPKESGRAAVERIKKERKAKVKRNKK